MRSGEGRRFFKKTFMTNTNIKKIEQAKTLIEEVLDLEHENFDSKSETWQESEKGEQAQQNIYCLSSAIDSLGEIC